MALTERESEIAQPRELLGILDSLGDGTQAQTVGERDDRAHERSVRLVVQAVDERLRNLEHVRREAADVAGTSPTT
jgi:hypothetical protein